MNKTRLEAFSDGVIAIIITIMVLELKAPAHAAHIGDLEPLVPVLLSYVLSFVYVGIFWVNHHHVLQATRGVSGGVRGRPVGESAPALLALAGPVRDGVDGGERLCAGADRRLWGRAAARGTSYLLLEWTIVAAHRGDTPLAKAVGRDRKAMLSLGLYAAAIPAAFANRWIAGLLYALVAVMWLVPDRRIERALAR